MKKVVIQYYNTMIVPGKKPLLPVLLNVALEITEKVEKLKFLEKKEILTSGAIFLKPNAL